MPIVRFIDLLHTHKVYSIILNITLRSLSLFKIVTPFPYYTSFNMNVYLHVRCVPIEKLTLAHCQTLVNVTASCLVVLLFLSYRVLKILLIKKRFTLWTAINFNYVNNTDIRLKLFQSF